MRYLICTILFLLSLTCLHAQDIESVTDLIQQLTDYINEDQNIYQLTEDLEALSHNPININNTTKQELQTLFFLDDRQINSILKYRKAYGVIKTIYELKAIPFLDDLAIKYMLPFVTVQSADIKSRRYFSIKGYQRLSTYVEKAKGFLTDSLGASPYKGSPYQVLSKISANYGSKAEANIVFEKDRGETAINPKTNQPEFISGSIGIKEFGFMDQIILGDYKLYLGQGLIASTDRFMGKSMPFDGLAQRYNTFVPYRSSGESNFLRGAAFSTHLKHWQFHAFGSRRKRDASLDSLAEEGIVFNSFYTTGLHRTTNELNKYHTVTEKIIGAKTAYSNNWLEIAAYSFNSYFDIPLLSFDRADTKNLFSGDALHYTGTSYRINLNTISLFGELAKDSKQNYAFISGANLYPNDFTSCQIIYRKYPFKYYSIYGAAFSESNIRNEEGFFIKIITTPIAKTCFTSYIDVFHFPGIRYGEISPTKGKSFFFRTDYNANQRTKIYIKLKYDIKETSLSKSSFESVTRPWTRWQGYAQLTSLISSQIKLRTKIGYIDYKLEESSKGMLLLQDISWKFFNEKALINGRYAVFETDSYESRLYAYENDVLYYFAIPAYSGKGQRIYLTARFKFSRHLTIEGKLGRYKYWDKTEIGSGNDLIKGNRKTDFKLQVRWRL